MSISTPEPLVHELVARQARLTPDAPAVGMAGAWIDYRELDSRAAACAARLRAAGVRRGDVVAVVAERSPDLVIALLGILKAGAGYLAVEADVPAERLRYVLDDAAPSAVLADPACWERCARGADRERTLSLSAVTGPGAVPGPGVAEPCHPEQTAYVSYTSGSTGRPKGVCVPHRAVTRLVHRTTWAAFGPDDVFLQYSPVAFDASTLELWAPLATGGRLVVLPPGRVSADRVTAAVAEQGVTVLWLTAGLFHQIAGSDPAALRGVRHLLAGGDVVSPAQVDRLFSALGAVRFTNGYGPTENTTFTACWTTQQPVAAPVVPIGHPIDGTGVLVLDDAGREVAAGETGELYATGLGLAHGYLGRPGLTADRFLPAPAGDAGPGERMYRTGDLVRRRADGALEFLGRADTQVKVQGFRVELGEIEATLTRVPRVREAVVTSQPDTAGGKRLLAYIVVEPGADPAGTAAAARAAARESLPSYMAPWAVLPLAALPLNPNGKVDRAALPAARRAVRDVDCPYVAPGTATEQVLADVWSEVLGVEPVGAEDDFFELGGHSLLAAELAVQIRQVFGADVPARTLYLQPTVAALAEAVERQAAGAPELVAAEAVR